MMGPAVMPATAGAGSAGAVARSAGSDMLNSALFAFASHLWLVDTAVVVVVVVVMPVDA